ncbi:hypothetical protein DE146DRAFT_39183 [Phaeosphaeria sp. MPI-PUGE-AT-0046c]|nr:hypothetical protein DE146DRAFT_39183 [Phaeosphaeria sp. MPI-PUGE-AT-0046c]
MIYTLTVPVHQTHFDYALQYLTMKISGTFILAAFFLAALCGYIWDESQLFQFAAEDNLHKYFAHRGNGVMCSLSSSTLGAGTQLRSPDNPPTPGTRWNPKYVTLRKAKNWRNKVSREWAWRSVDPSPKASGFAAQGWEEPLKALHHYFPKENWKYN